MKSQTTQWSKEKGPDLQNTMKKGKIDRES
jgi:hypothetical protein